MAESMDRMSTTIGSMTHQALNFSTASSVFEGFTNNEICYVSSDIWEILPKMNSCTIQVHQEQAFDSLESQVSKSYGSPQEMANNRRIYRGEIPTSNGSTCVTITFYSTTLKVRVQGSGYAMWVNKILPSLVDIIMAPSSMTSSTPMHNSRHTAMHTPANVSSNNSASEHCNLHKDFLRTVLNATEERAKLEKENAMLKDRIKELSDDNSKLNQKLTEKEIQLESMMARVAEVDLLEFESASNLKLLEATEAKFADERKHLLQQIQELTNKDQSSPSSPASKTSPPTYSEVLQWSTVKSKRHSNTPTTSCVKPVTTPNRFALLSDEDSRSSSPSSTDSPPPAPVAPNPKRTRKESSSPPQPPATQTGVHQSEDRKFKHGSEKPKIHLFGDSISKRIDGQRLSRNSDVTNHSKSGRRLEQVTDDVKNTDLSNADSVIINAGTNNLQRDTKDVICAKFRELFQCVKSQTKDLCNVAFSSIIRRTDRPELVSKLDHANEYINQLCEEYNWTYIDNHAVKDLHQDGLHPNAKGMSFLARNYQDFIRCAHPSIFREGRKKTFQRRTNARDPVLANAPTWLKMLMMPRMMTQFGH